MLFKIVHININPKTSSTHAQKIVQDRSSQSLTVVVIQGYYLLQLLVCLILLESCSALYTHTSVKLVL